MIKGLREKQYQLAAQKRNEVQLRFKYYNQIADYFEREGAVTRQFNSWASKDNENNLNYLQKITKEKKLQIRREKLRRLLNDEDKQFHQECEDPAKNCRSQQQHEQSLTLEALRQRLLEKRAEQNLYLPSRKKHQSYFYHSDSLIDPPRKDIVPKSANSKTSKMSLAGTCFENGYSKSHTRSHVTEVLNRSSRDVGSVSFAAVQEDNHHNLEETNHSKEVNENNIDTTDFVQNRRSVDHCNGNGTIMEETREALRAEENSRKVQEIDLTKKVVVENGAHANKSDHQFVSSQKDAHVRKYFSKADDGAAGKSMDNWENERSLPWSRAGADREQNLSIPMYLYLKNSDIKSKIMDLGKRELQACRGYRWDEALRLRDMRNKLSLTREHQLLNAVGLRLDEQTRVEGIKSISERQKVINEREKICSNGCLYSEEAKDLWKKWEAEDEVLGKDKSFIDREKLMQSLEDDWKALAVEDKDRISNLYEKTKNNSDLQNEHQLMKQFGGAQNHSYF